MMFYLNVLCAQSLRVSLLRLPIYVHEKDGVGKAEILGVLGNF